MKDHNHKSTCKMTFNLKQSAIIGYQQKDDTKMSWKKYLGFFFYFKENVCYILKICRKINHYADT